MEHSRGCGFESKAIVFRVDSISKSYVVDTKKFSLSKLKYAVQKMEGLSFVDGKNSLSGKDILGDFFEGIIRNGFKQSKGQFFTHINIVRFMLYALQADKLAIKRIKDDKEIPYMIDPSAGIVIQEFPMIDISLDEQQRIVDEIHSEIEKQELIKAKIASLRSEIDRIVEDAAVGDKKT